MSAVPHIVIGYTRGVVYPLQICSGARAAVRTLTLHAMTAIVESSEGTRVLTLLAPVSGVIVPLGRVPDPAFAQRLAGDGAAIEPLSDTVVAPCDARVVQVHRARHALTLTAAGLEIIIHVGLDTVMLNGAGFTALVKAGDDVQAGEPLLRFDPDSVARSARSLMTVVLVANMESVAAIEHRSGLVSSGRDVLMRVRLAGPAAVPAAAASGDAVISPPIRIAAASGLHARPAAAIAAAVRHFTADVRLVKDAREANARSVVSIMALEVGGGDTVTVVARGDGAADAIEAVRRLLTSELAEVLAPPLPAPPYEIPTAPQHVPGEDGILRGVAASPGVAIGNIYQLRYDDTVHEQRGADPIAERRVFDVALSAAHAQLEGVRAQLAASADGAQAAIFAAHQELLEDPEVLDVAAAEIRAGASAAYAWQQAYTSQANRLAALDNPLLAARATDMRDVGRRVLHLLVGGGAVSEIPVDSIVVAQDFTPSDAAALDRARVRGFCTTTGSATSHVAILARGLGIPAVAGIDARVLALTPGTRVVLDGDAGVLRTRLTADDEVETAARQGAAERQRAEELAAAGAPAVTRDGHRVEVVANLGDAAEAGRVPEVGGEGVGLLRSEFLFMHRQSAPTEDEQAATYEAIAHALGPDRILVIRTLDVGGDKPLPYLPVPAEENPFLGERGVRLTLARPELFRAQIRAILRASRSGKVAMMFPMIATLAEWRAARAMVEEEREALGALPIPVGIMVETAAAALMAEHFAREADFLSLGTNDLTQYTLAMDRTNQRLAPYVDALHPSVLKLIRETVAGAHAHGRWVGVCGALASDLTAVPVLIGLGVDELSVDVSIVPAVKARVRALSLTQCRRAAEEALAAPDGATVRAIVTRMQAANPEETQ